MFRAGERRPAGPRDVDAWAATLPGLRADALDCLQTTFALVADHAHGPGSHLALGTRLGFARTEPSLDDRLAEARALLGLRVVTREADLRGPELRRLAAGLGPLYVVADAYDLWWVPYAGHSHMAHSFLLTETADGWAVVDAYRNDTEWGEARPGVWEVSPEQLDAAARHGAVAVAVSAGGRPRLDVAAALAANVARLEVAAPDIERRVAEMQEGIGDAAALERLVLEVWLLGRERALHAAWLESLAPPPVAARAAAEHVEAWQQLAAQAYVALHRARRGRPASLALAEELRRLLAADLALARRLAGDRDTSVRAAVLGAIRNTLDVDDLAIEVAPTLRDLPGFSSLRLVEVIERVERRLGVDPLADGITAGDLRDVDALCRLFARVAR
jgi:hypothetical protein